MKITLEDKYNQCLALNIELEEIIEMLNQEIIKKNERIYKLEQMNLRLTEKEE